MAEIRTLSLSELKPAPYNPRKIEPAAMAALEKSIERFGLVEPIIWNQRSGFVVGGHQRLKVLRRKKAQETEVVVVDLAEIDERALNLAMNNPHIAGEFSDKLAELLAEIKGANETLFVELRLDQLLAEADAKRRDFLAQDDLDEAPAPPKNPVTKLGDVWTLDRHRLICGDSTDQSTITMLLGEERVDSLITDPPYGVDYGKNQELRDEIHGMARGSRKGRHIKNDVGLDYRQWYASWLSLIAWDSNATFYVFMAMMKLHHLVAAIEDCEFKIGNQLVWVKDRQTFGRSDYAYKHEEIVYGWPVRHRFFAPGKPASVLEYASARVNDLHPTMKPIALLEQLVSDGSADASIILDLFGGSGSTLIACEASHRRCRMAEIDPAYCDVIVERWQNLTGGKATRASGKSSPASKNGSRAKARA